MSPPVLAPIEPASPEVAAFTETTLDALPRWTTTMSVAASRRCTRRSTKRPRSLCLLTLAFGLVASREAMAIPEALIARAASHLDLFDEKADLLRAAARLMIARKA